MTIQEAIERIKYRIYTATAVAGNGIDGNAFEDLEMAIEALERQTPKKVIIENWNPARCPTCGMELSESLGDGYYKHPTFLEVCPSENCCQRLDWSGDNE